jgi:hypothetical protein
VVHRRQVYQHVRQCAHRPQLFERLVPYTNKFIRFV